MHLTIDDLAKGKEYGPGEEKFSPNNGALHDREDRHNGSGVTTGGDDFRIMQHFVREMIDGTEDGHPL